MNIKITALTDYKKKFGSKHFDNPYRSGMDKNLLTKYFNELGIEITFNYFHEVDFRKNSYKGENIIYTSSEDIDYYYKSYIEDVVYALELSGANVIPAHKYLRANNNKVFMEQIRDIALRNDSLYSYVFGSLKDLLLEIEKINYPCVLKESEGASGTGVYLITNRKDLIKKIKLISKSANLKEDLKDYFRILIHKGYQRESRYRTKFIIQKLIPELNNDWKIYVFWDKYYIFYRPILKGRGIRASGGGYDNYYYGLESKPPAGIFDFAKSVFDKLETPHISIDVAYDGDKFYLLEFQSLYFGTAGIQYSNEYFIRRDNNWEPIKQKLDIEKVYVDSIVGYIENLK